MQAQKKSIRDLFSTGGIREIEDYVIGMDFFNALSKRNKVVFGLWLNGFTINQIALLIDCGYSRTHELLSYIRYDLTRYYREGKQPLRFYQMYDFAQEELLT